jgi:DNA (cytosine-5)-methyltransferase 1
VTRPAVAPDGCRGDEGAMWSAELCAGAGGLAIATTQAGFTPQALLESDPVACETIGENRRRGSQWVKAWPAVSPTDIRDFDYSSLRGPIALLSGGPPCQPFSIAGKHLGIDDDRDLFTDVARAIRYLRPRALLIENTEGLARKTFERQLRYICLQLALPGLRRGTGEHWERFLERLERAAASARADDYNYIVSWSVLNAADYGVPQQRKRLMIVGLRGTDQPPFTPPPATHSLDALLYQQWVTKEYWDRHEVATRHRPEPPKKWEARIKRLRAGEPPAALPWVTVRDAISSLPEPVESPPDGGPLNHCLRLGARAYPRHTGSWYDLPAKVLKAGRHGVPGGENMLAYPDGRVRYFTVRECARLQTFPDDYFFTGSWKALTRQLGNAVPVLMCRRVAEAIRNRLKVPCRRAQAAGAVPALAGPPRRKVAR